MPFFFFAGESRWHRTAHLVHESHGSAPPHLKENARPHHQVSARASLPFPSRLRPHSSIGRVVPPARRHPIRSSHPPVTVTPRRHAPPAAAVAVTVPLKATRTPAAMDFSTASASSRDGAAARVACWLGPWSKAHRQRSRAHHRAEPAGPHAPPPPPGRSSGHAAGPRVGLGAGAKPARRGDGRGCSGQAGVRRGRVRIGRRAARVGLPPRSPGECCVPCEGGRSGVWRGEWLIGRCCSRARLPAAWHRGVKAGGIARKWNLTMIGARTLLSATFVI